MLYQTVASTNSYIKPLHKALHFVATTNRQVCFIYNIKLHGVSIMQRKSMEWCVLVTPCTEQKPVSTQLFKQYPLFYVTKHS